MGKWYLSRLDAPVGNLRARLSDRVFDHANGQTEQDAILPLPESAVILYRNPEVERLQALTASARSRLAELEAAYTKDKLAVDYIQAQILSGSASNIRPETKSGLSCNIAVNFSTH